MPRVLKKRFGGPMRRRLTTNFCTNLR
ncbi:hypothetical protein MTBSS4_450023 [Magnetospirillum sp. SS-4]|nr:hypothetical protein MTBSS4_450023 [Magnetospirillum sp. SS-4]